ncbi:hypothetical protein TNCV_334141 [Trichonephila clavipes]|nr:hypothetical protein TNCV_334141 [Trichonephila clavipes]
MSTLSERRQERETLIRELKIVQLCTDPNCPDHSSTAQAGIDENNTLKISQAADSLKQRKIKEIKPKSANNAREIGMTLSFLKIQKTQLSLLSSLPLVCVYIAWQRPQSETKLSGLCPR